MQLNPADTIRAGGDVDVLDDFGVGGKVAFAGSQYLDGDPSNAKLAAIAVFNLRPSYQLDDRWQAFDIVDNLFDNRDALYGTYFDPSDTAGLIAPTLNGPRTLTLRQAITI